MRSLGWEPRYPIREAVGKTIQYLIDNPWLFASRT
jgi:nucleoside-diphosphate-sugar epimerase